MAIVAALRADSLNLRRAGGSQHGQAIGAAVTADASSLGDTRIDMTGGTGKNIIYESRGNLFDGRAGSALIRIKANVTGAPGASYALFNLGPPTTALMSMGFQHHTTNQLRVHAINELGSVLASEASFGTLSLTSGTRYDLGISWTGDTTSNGTKAYLDAVSLGNVTLGGNFSASLMSYFWKMFCLGISNRVSTSNLSIEEFVLWDEIIDFTGNVTLESGSGLLNGDARTSYVSAAALDGSSYSDPGVANVSNGVSYTYAGSTLTGTLQTVTNTISNTTLTPVGPLAAILEEV
jgi:lipopolysaccharide export system protein LptA